jgi:hypothetical protein
VCHVEEVGLIRGEGERVLHTSVAVFDQPSRELDSEGVIAAEARPEHLQICVCVCLFVCVQ